MPGSSPPYILQDFMTLIIFGKGHKFKLLFYLRWRVSSYRCSVGHNYAMPISVATSCRLAYLMNITHSAGRTHARTRARYRRELSDLGVSSVIQSQWGDAIWASRVADQYIREVGLQFSQYFTFLNSDEMFLMQLFQTWNFVPCATNIQRSSRNEGGVDDFGGDGGVDVVGRGWWWAGEGYQLSGLRFVTSRSLPKKIPE